MNCWQFVLLCLLESGYLTEKQIAILYLHYMNSPIKDKRITDYFGRNYSVKGEPGDIILFKRKDGLGTIWHIGILTNIEEETIQYIDMLGYSVNITTERKDKIPDELLFITTENLIEPIIKLESIRIDIQPAIYDKIRLKKFLINIYFKKEIFEYVSKKWDDLLERNRNSNIEFETLYQQLDPSGYKFIKDAEQRDIDYTYGNKKFYEEKSKRLFFEKKEYQFEILAQHDLLDLVQ
jgi:hypothetical protein